MYSIFLSKINISFNLIKDRLKEIIKETDKVVIIPWAFATEINADTLDKYFNEKKRDKYVNPLLELGIKQSNITVLNCYRDNEEYMIDKIKNSNVLVLPGGNPEMFYNKVVNHHLLEVIKNYDKVVIGESAGTELQLNNYFITAKNNYYKKFDWYKGFGIIDDPFYMDVHSSNNYRYLNKLQKTSNEKKKNVYAIYDDGAIILNRKTNQLEFFGNIKEFKPNK
mgnify:FL=1